MSIDYMTDIVNSLFDTSVGNQAAYQSPGDFGLPASFNSPNDAQKRLLTFIEIVHNYFDIIESVHEAKLLGQIIAKMMMKVKAGTVLNDNSALAQADALEYIAHRLQGFAVPEEYFLETLDGNVIITEDNKILILE